jgi:hypothetical protein
MALEPIGHTEIRRPHTDTTKTGHTDAIAIPHSDTPAVHTDVEKIHTDVAAVHVDVIDKPV